MTEANPQGSSESLSLDQGAEALSSLIGDEQRGQSVEPDEATADSSAEQADTKAAEAETETEPDDDSPPEEPRKIRLPDGSEAGLEEIAEWKKGYLRQADYTRKTMELAATRRELESRLSEFTQKAQNFEQAAVLAMELIKAQLPEPPDPALAYSDPIAYTQKKAEYDARNQQLQQLAATWQSARQARMAQEQQALSQYASAERDMLLEKMPELRDQAKARRFAEDIMQGLSRYYGATEADLSQIYDHRVLLLARDAIAYRRLMENKPKAERTAPASPTQKPGSRASPEAQKARVSKEKWDRLQRTGSLEDGGAVLLELIKG